MPYYMPSKDVAYVILGALSQTISHKPTVLSVFVLKLCHMGTRAR